MDAHAETIKVKKIQKALHFLQQIKICEIGELLCLSSFVELTVYHLKN